MLQRASIITRITRVVHCSACYFLLTLLQACRVKNKKWVSRVHSSFGQSLLVLLGVKLTSSEATRYKGSRPILYISNHDSFIDAIVVAGCFRFKCMIHDEISNLKIPFLKWNLFKLGSFFVTRPTAANTKIRLYNNAINKACTILREHGEFFIFPSGGIVSPIERKCSRSIYYIAKKTSAVIIPVFFKYEKDALSLRRFDNDFHYLNSLVCRQGEETLGVEFLSPLDPSSFQSASALTEHIKALYKKLRC